MPSEMLSVPIKKSWQHPGIHHATVVPVAGAVATAAAASCDLDAGRDSQDDDAAVLALITFHRARHDSSNLTQ